MIYHKIQRKLQELDIRCRNEALVSVKFSSPPTTEMMKSRNSIATKQAWKQRRIDMYQRADGKMRKK